MGASFCLFLSYLIEGVPHPIWGGAWHGLHRQTIPLPAGEAFHACHMRPGNDARPDPRRLALDPIEWSAPGIRYTGMKAICLSAAIAYALASQLTAQIC